jgi:hypothetical protein
MMVIHDNPNIYRDSTLDSMGSSPLLDEGSDGSGTASAGDNFYNDIKH